MSSTHTSVRVDFDQDVADRLEQEDADTDYRFWWCIATRPFPCPAPGCDYVAVFQTAAHLIIVWPAKDDRALMNAALRCREAGRDPRIVQYDESFGACIAFDLWRRIGAPVHGRLPAPDGWENIPRL